MQIVRTTDSKIIPVYDSQTQVYTVSVCTKEAYEDIREEFKNNRDQKVIEPFIYIDDDGNWSLGLSISNKPGYYSEDIPDYLKNYVYPISADRKWRMYSDVWYHAAKDGKMGKQIYGDHQIPADATHIIEIHK
jgi:hypothetical protein